MKSSSGIAGLVLAAGASRRMGTDKALLRFRGRTFLEAILATLEEAGVERRAVVLGHHAEQIQAATNLANVQVVVNPHYALGQTSSLQAGLRALEEPGLEAVVLGLVDHPAVSASTVRQLMTVYRNLRPAVAVPIYRGQRGHPVVLDRALFHPLMALSAEEGANTVIRQFGDRTQPVVVDDPGVTLDIDDPEALARWEAAKG